MIEIKNNIKAVLLSVYVLLGTIQSFAQIRVPFTPRTSTDASAPYAGAQNYNLQGDFTMIGNTNLTLVNYYETGNSSHNGNSMRYVDVDNVTTTLNSSSAQLNIPDANCSEIIYAGLYWTGRAHDGNVSPDIIPVGSTNSRNNNNSFNGYSLSITSSANNNAVYEFTPNNGGSKVIFRFTGTNITVQIGSGSQTSISGTITNTNNTSYTITLAAPYLINTGAQTIYINSLQRTNNSTNINNNYSASVTSDVTKLLDKRKVQLKKDNLPYKEITATEIYFPNGISDNLYSGYADVTDYIRTNGVGNYFVADIATQEGTLGSIGPSAGWGMVIIYKNTSMKWRDITVFDGFGFMNSSSGATTLPVSGFRAAQRGPVNIKLGMMAGEGDNYYSGDFFNIKNAAGSWRRIDKNGSTAATTNNGASSSGNSNFFNSSVLIGGAPRNPDLVNNTGVDFVMFDLQNPWENVNGGRYSIIPNNAASAEFQFGTSQDVYSIFNIVFAVDAYVPEVVGENTPANAGTVHNSTVIPGQDLVFDLKIYNKGEEAVNNTKVEIPIPFNMHYSPTATIHPGTGTVAIPAGTTVSWVPPTGAPSSATPQNTPGGKLVWTIGTLPKDDSKSILQGTLKYKLRVTENCALLATAGPCGLKVKINGKITGVGATSTTPVSSDLVRDYGAAACAGPIYDDFESTIAVSQSFIQNCTPPPVENGMLQFVAFCSLPDNEFPRAQIVGEYSWGTKFFTSQPANYDQTTDVLTGDFSVTTDGTKTTYWAVVPGMDPGCFIRLQTSLTLVTTSPTAQNIALCAGKPIILSVTRSATGVANNYQLFYYSSSSSTTPMTSIPNAAGTYWVAEGVNQSGVICTGPKVQFTVTVNPLPVVQQNLSNISICENNNTQFIVTASTPAGTITYQWEYASASAPMVWNTFSNSTYSGQITVNNGSLNITNAVRIGANSINGMKVRLKVINTNGCEEFSNEVVIQIKDCRAITNPMLPNKAKKQS